MFTKNELWSTAVFEGGNILSLEELNIATLPLKKLLHTKKLRTTKTHIHTIADPFLFVHDDLLYLFVEEKRSFDRGVISYYTTENMNDWKYGGVVLKENYHLSYPFVFSANDDIYMLPESSESNGIFLYKAKNFPSEWDNPIKLLDGKFVDSNIVFYNNKYWLFASKGYDELHLFYSDDLVSGWRQIKDSPVVKSLKAGRNGGGVFHYNDSLYRVAQNCENRYGGSLDLYLIQKLDTSDYKEKLLEENILGNSYWWNKLGGHHFSLSSFKGKNIIAIDGKSYDCFLNKIIGLTLRFIK